MTKEQIIEIIRLLSSLEAWSFAEKRNPPDFILERLDKAIEVLTREVLK